MPSAQAQPIPPERLPPVDTVAARLVADGLLSDALVAEVRARTGDAPLTRAGLLELSTIHLATTTSRPPGPLPADPDSLVARLFPPAGLAVEMADRLRAAGAISERTLWQTVRRFEALDASFQPGRDTLRAALARGEAVSVINPMEWLFSRRLDLLALQSAQQLTEREERIAPEQVRPLLDSLAGTGHLSAADRDLALTALASGATADLGGLLGRLPRLRVLRPEALPADPAGAAGAAADTLAAMLRRTGVADLHLSAVTARLETDRPAGRDGGMQPWTLVVDADVDGRRYAAEARGWTSTGRRGTFGAPGPADAVRAVVDLVNKALRDRGLVHRLALAEPDASELEEPDLAALAAAPEWVEPVRPVVVLALTPAEAALYRAGRLLSPRFPWDAGSGDPASAQEARLTTDRVATHVALLVRLGLVADSARVAGEHRLARAYVTTPGQIFGAVGLTWSTSELDVDTENESPFGALVRVLAGLSRGVFAPAEIEETFSDGGRVAFAFSLGGRRVAANLETWETGFDDGFLPLVNRALAETGAEGRFLDLEPETDESATYLFVTSEQHAALAEAGLLGGP